MNSKGTAVYSVVLLAAVKKPAASRAKRPHTLVAAAARTPPLTFVGRARDVEALEERLENARLLSLVGPGGIGKTRLAQQFAAVNARSYSEHDGGGVWFVDLNSAQTALDIVFAVAAVLGVKLAREVPEHTFAEVLGRAIALRGRVLLILDNFDKLTASGPVLEGWLSAAPSARFLVTSRVALGLGSEHVWRLAPLDPSAAAELFVERARLVCPGIDPARERVHIASIVESIDGLPLAIELAATRMTILTATQLSERLKRSRGLLEGKAESGRHRTMRQTVLDSLELVGAQERGLFVACSVLQNGFTLEAVEAILGGLVLPTSSVLCALETLVTCSLLRVHIEPGDEVARFALFETLRDVARELQAEHGNVDLLRAAHQAYYASLFATASFARAPVAGDLSNLLAAQAHALVAVREANSAVSAGHVVALVLAVDPVLSARGNSVLREQLASQGLEVFAATQACDDVGRARIHLMRGLARTELGNPAAAIIDYDAALALAETQQNAALSATARTQRGILLDRRGDTSGAREQFILALQLLEASDVPMPERAIAVLQADAHLCIGHSRRREGELPSARTASATAAGLYRAASHHEGLASALYELAVIEMFLGNTEASLAHFDEGIRIAAQSDMQVVLGALQTARGCLLQDLGKLSEALEHHATGARIFAECSSRYREASALYYLATTYLERGDRDECITVLQRARARLRGLGAVRYEALMSSCQAVALGLAEDHAGARAALEAAHQAAAQVGYEPALTCALHVHTLTLAALVRPVAADSARALLAEAQTRVALSPNDDSRFALRMLQRVLAGDASAVREALVVFAQGSAFALPGQSAPVRLPEGSPLRRILICLAQRRIDAPGEAVAIEAIIAAGWPTEKIRAQAGLNRAYVALAALRKLGLREMLLQGNGGYALAQSVVVQLADAPNLPV